MNIAISTRCTAGYLACGSPDPLNSRTKSSASFHHRDGRVIDTVRRKVRSNNMTTATPVEAGVSPRRGWRRKSAERRARPTG